MNAQDIWNEFRNSRFAVTDRVMEMVKKMKDGPEILRGIFLASSGNFGLSELLVHSYYDSRYELCKFLLETGVNPNMAKRFINPSFNSLNELFQEYGYSLEKTEEYLKFYKEKVSNYPFI